MGMTTSFWAMQTSTIGGRMSTKDGKPDRIGLAPLNVPSRVYVNNGKGVFSPGPVIASGNDNTRPVALGDVDGDGDGDSDIVMGNDCQPNHVFFNSLRTSGIPGP